jgi:2-aminoadipate transaminase
MNYTHLYSRTAKTTSKSAIREMLKLAERPEVISFAGGWPSPSLFPVDDLKRLMVKVLDERGRKVLHYSLAEGEMALKQEVIRYMARDHIHAEPENIVMLTGSQQGMDMLPKAFVDRGDIIFLETPSYVGAIQAFNNYGTRMIPVATDGAGMDPKALAATVRKCRRNGQGKRMKMIYLIPDFQNPSGITMSEERRIGVLEVAARNNLLVIEDAPYRHLRFEGQPIPSLYELDKNEDVVTLFSFSKLLVPGFRIGWLVGPKPVVDLFVTLKQSIDLCSSAFLQHVAAEYMKEGLMDKYLPTLIASFREKRDIMLRAMDNAMPKIAGLEWTRPDGGFYVWVTLPRYMDAADLFRRAVEQNVAFVLGPAFHPQGKLKNCFRLNFTFVSTEDIREGIRRLGKAVAEYSKVVRG